MAQTSHMYGETDGEGELRYSTAQMSSGPAAFKYKPRADDDSVTVLVDSGAFGHYFDDPITPCLKHHPAQLRSSHYATQDPHCRRSLAGRTAKGILQGLVTDNHGEQHLARIAIFIVPGIGYNLLSVKSATKKGIVSIFDFDNPRLELSGIIVPLRAEDDDLYSLTFDSSADRHGGKELLMNAMTNTELWRRRPGHLNKRRLELMQRCDGNGVAFEGLINHCDVCAVGKSHQLAHPKKAKHADIMAPL